MKGFLRYALQATLLVLVLSASPSVTFGQTTDTPNRDYNNRTTERTTDWGFNPGWLGLAGLLGLLGLINRNNNHRFTTTTDNRTHPRT